MRSKLCAIVTATLLSAAAAADVTVKSNLSRAIADSLYCQMSGCTMSGALNVLDGANFTVQNTATPTKQLRFSLSGITAANTRTWTVPDADTSIPIISQTITFTGPSLPRTYTLVDANSTLADLASPQAFTNKSYNGLTLTATTGTFTLTNGKTFAVQNGLTLAGADSTVMNFPSTSATIARIDAGQTFSGINSMNSTLRITSSGAISGGAGMEIEYNTGGAVGAIRAFDRVGSAYKAFTLNDVATVGVTGAISAVPSYNKVTITAPASGATLTIADGKTLTYNNSIAMNGTDGTAMTFPSTSATIARSDNGQTFSGTQTFASNPVNSAQAMTAGTMTVTNSSLVATVTHRFDWTNAMVTALGAVTAGDITVCTLPAKTVVKNVYVVIDTPDTSTNALTVAVGRVSATYIDYIVASDAKASASTVYGDASGERGTNLTGYDVPSVTGTTTVKAHFIKTTTNLNTVTGSTGHVYVETSILP